MSNKITQVRKRDESIIDFDKTRIESAVFKALTATTQGDGRRSKRIASRVVRIINRRFKKDDIPTVEQIQDIVEEVLILEGLVEAARAYILYREQRRRIREATTLFDESTEAVDKYIKELDWQVNENANMAYSLQGLNMYSMSVIAKKYWLNKIYPQEIREAGANEDFHIHNLDLLACYCMGWDLLDLLQRGFGGVASKIECRPPKHFRTALGQTVNFLFTLQGESAGANAISNFDTLLAPFIRYDGLDYLQVKQSLQEFLYNCMVPTRVGFQTPFLNVTMDIKVPNFMRNTPVIIGGKPQDEVYGDFQKEMDMFNRAFYECMLEGDAKNRPFTFPIPTISITKDFDWENPQLDMMWEATAKYGINYFSNFIQSDMSPDDVKSMCLGANEEVVIKNSGNIKRLSIKEVAENYKIADFDADGWSDCRQDKGLKVLSLNPKTLKTEWSPVKRFFRVNDFESVEITAEDGKKAEFSTKHPIPIFTPEGIQMKFSRDIKKGDYLLTLKKSGDSLSKNCQMIDDLIFNEATAKIMGYFIADGNYLFRSGLTHHQEGIRGMRFTFNGKDKENINLLKGLLETTFSKEIKEKKDPRYNTYYLYLYDSKLAQKFYKNGFKKYGRLPQIVFNSPFSVINSFLEFYFKGDGYKKRKEIHLNDLKLSRDLVLLFSLVGQPVTYHLRKNSQVIHLQRASFETKKVNNYANNPIIVERVPGWLAQSTYKVPGLKKSRMVDLPVLDKYNAHTGQSQKIKESDIYLVRVKKTTKKTSKELRGFYDLELQKNHLFVHSLGQISFNCCRLRLDKRELYKRGGGLFGSQPLTGCYDDKTEILTENGWILFKDLTKDDTVFTLTESNEIEPHKPTKLFEYDYEGEMFHFKAKSLDLLVTPNHRMMVDNVNKNYKREFVEAEKFNPSRHQIPKHSFWQGAEKEYFTLPSVEILKGNGHFSRFSQEKIRDTRTIRRSGNTYLKIARELGADPITIFNICTVLDYGQRHLTSYYPEPLEVKMDEWLKFFGFWLAEGCTDNETIAATHGYRVVITQVDQKKREEIRKVLDSLPFYYAEEKNNFVICNKQLWTYLRQFGNKYNKYVPKEIKNLSKRQLGVFFEWIVKGDGHIRKTTGQINYWTASKKLADDLQEIILKLGWLGTLTTQAGRTSQIRGRNIKGGIIYTLGVQQSGHYQLRKENIRKIYYKGKVYCCEVENNTVFVRHNGRVSWCGNSIGVVTINMPRIGYLSKTKKDFLDRLGGLMDLARDSLEIKRKALENFMEKGLYPYSRYYLQGVKQMRDTYFGNHFATIGLMGMNEALLNFLGENISTKRGIAFSLEVLDFMRARMIKYQEETGNLYNLEATPGEGTSYRQAKADRERYPKIITAGTKEVPYYTNSTMLPVDFKGDPFDALKLQDEIQCKYTGGVVFHTFLGERVSEPEAAKMFVKKVFERFHLPYITLTPTFSICPTHGYLNGEHFECPHCVIKQPCEVYSRVVGYLRPVQQWHKGKKQEFKERREFIMPRP